MARIFRSRFVTRWWRRLYRLRALLFAVSSHVLHPIRPSRGADILDVGRDGSIRVTKAAGPAPLRPRVVAHASFTNARTQRLARRAAVFLFDYYDFAVVPAQFWPVLERSFDPGKAMDAFLLAVGCKPELVRRRDRGELRRASDVIELLVRASDVLGRLNPEIKRVVEVQLESGDYNKVRELAEVAAHLETALDYAAPWAGKTVMATFADLLRTIQRMLDNPMRVAAADSASAVSLVAQFAGVQQRYDGLCHQFAALTDALRDAWPEIWHGSSQETVLRRHVGDFESVAHSMQDSVDRTFTELNEGNDFLLSCITALENLLEAARGGGTSRRRKRSPPPPDEKEVALRYFGFSSATPPVSKQELRDAWKKKIRVLHPDANPGASDEELERLTEEWHQCEKYYNALLVRFSWHRSA